MSYILFSGEWKCTRYAASLLCGSLLSNRIDNLFVNLILVTLSLTKNKILAQTWDDEIQVHVVQLMQQYTVEIALRKSVVLVTRTEAFSSPPYKISLWFGMIFEALAESVSRTKDLRVHLLRIAGTPIGALDIRLPNQLALDWCTVLAHYCQSVYYEPSIYTVGPVSYVKPTLVLLFLIVFDTPNEG